MAQKKIHELTPAEAAGLPDLIPGWQGTPEAGITVYFTLEQIKTLLGGGAALPANVVAALNGANSPAAGNPFATIADIPEANNEPHVINPGRLSILSPTSASLQNAKWRHLSGIFDYTGNPTLQGSPTAPNNRFDAIMAANGLPPIVRTGTPGEDPVVPTPNPGELLLHIIYRPHTGDDVVVPVNPKAPATAVQAGLQGKYAPIWRQTVQKNTYYGFKISFMAWSSEYQAHGQYPLNGLVLVNFITGATTTVINPNAVSVRSIDIGVDNGDFVLVQSGTAEVTLYARKKSYLGNMVFDYSGPYHDTVRADSLVRGGTYGDLPTGSAPVGNAYPSYNGRDYVNSSLPVRFDIPRQYGFDTPVTGPITFPAAMGDPLINPARVDTGNVAIVRHNAPVEPPFNQPAGLWKRCDGGTYEPNVDNDYYIVARKNAAGTVVGLSYTITQNVL